MVTLNGSAWCKDCVTVECGFTSFTGLHALSLIPHFLNGSKIAIIIAIVNCENTREEES